MSKVTHVAASPGNPARRSLAVSGCSKAVSSSAAMHGTTTMYRTPIRARSGRRRAPSSNSRQDHAAPVCSQLGTRLLSAMFPRRPGMVYTRLLRRAHRSSAPGRSAGPASAPASHALSARARPCRARSDPLPRRCPAPVGRGVGRIRRGVVLIRRGSFCPPRGRSRCRSRLADSRLSRSRASASLWAAPTVPMASSG